MVSAKTMKTFAYVKVKNLDKIHGSPLKGSHKFGLFKQQPETWFIDGLPDLDTWKEYIREIFNQLPLETFHRLPLMIGHVKLFHKDVYNRKEGIRLAKEKADLELFKIDNITYAELSEYNDYLFSLRLRSSKTGIYLIVYPNGRPKIQAILELESSNV